MSAATYHRELALVPVSSTLGRSAGRRRTIQGGAATHAIAFSFQAGLQPTSSSAPP